MADYRSPLGVFNITNGCYAGLKCELSVKNICFNNHRVFNAEVAEAQRTQRKTLKTLYPLRL